MNPHELFTRVLTATTADEIDALEELFHPEFVGDSPQSGERVHGFAGFRAQIDNYPGEVEVEADSGRARVFGGEERWAITPNYTVVPLSNRNEYTALTRSRYPDGSWWWMVLLVTLRDEKIFRVVSYFAPEFEPPDWRRPFVEVVPRD